MPHPTVKMKTLPHNCLPSNPLSRQQKCWYCSEITLATGFFQLEVFRSKQGILYTTNQPAIHSADRAFVSSVPSNESRFEGTRPLPWVGGLGLGFGLTLGWVKFSFE